MGSRILLTALEKSIDHYWRELEIRDVNQLLDELEKGGQITTEERQSLLFRLERKKASEAGK